MSDADDIARVAEHLEGIAHSLELLMPAVRAVRSSVIKMSQSVAEDSEFAGSHEELQAAITHHLVQSLGLERIEEARLRIVAAVHDPLAEVTAGRHS